MLYLLGGENLYLSTKRLESLKHSFQKDRQSVIRVFNADEIDNCDKILQSADSFSLFKQKQLFIIKRLSSSNSVLKEHILNYLQENQHTEFIFWEDKNLDKRRRLYKLIKKQGIVEEFGKLSSPKLRIWLCRYLQEKTPFDPECIDILLMKIGNDQMQLVTIVDNLITMIKADKKEQITAEDIEKFVQKTAEENIWDFVDAIGDNDRAKAVKIIERLMIEQKDFRMLVGMIARQFRVITMIKYLLKIAKPQTEIVKILRLHPFVVSKTIPQVKHFNFQHLKILYGKLLQIDMGVKQGKFDGKLALDLLMVVI